MWSSASSVNVPMTVVCRRPLLMCLSVFETVPGILPSPNTNRAVLTEGSTQRPCYTAVGAYDSRYVHRDASRRDWDTSARTQGVPSLGIRGSQSVWTGRCFASEAACSDVYPWQVPFPPRRQRWRIPLIRSQGQKHTSIPQYRRLAYAAMS